jgi:hypothetical protein
MASLNPNVIYTPQGHDGWRYRIELSIASTSGQLATINYSVIADGSLASGSTWIQTSNLSLYINSSLTDTKQYEYLPGTPTDGRIMMSGTFSSLSPINVSFIGGFYTNTSSDCNIDQTVYIEGLGYTVIFDLAGGYRTGGGELSQFVEYGGSAIPPTCANDGYNFIGWNGDYTNVTSDRTIYAQWEIITYTITYDANGGSGAPGPQNKNYGQNIQLSGTIPTKSYTINFEPNGGYVSPISKIVNCIFQGWNTNASGSGTWYQPNQTYTENNSVTLYAIYQNPNIGDLPTPTRDRCILDAWTLSLNGNDNIDSSYTVTNSITIYAKWKYEIMLHGNGGKIYVPPNDRLYDTYTEYKSHNIAYVIPSYSVTKTDSISTSGQIFQRYSTNPDATSAQYIIGSNFNDNVPTDLYAIFQSKTFIVTFEDGYSGTVIVRYTDVPYGGSVTPPEAPTRPGYVFMGWMGNYQNVRSDSTVVAIWSFLPVWILTESDQGRTWELYMPKED